MINVQRLHKPLEEAGLVPPHCRLLELQIGVGGALSVKYEVYLDAAQVVRLGMILQDVGNELLAGPPRDSEPAA